MSLNATTVGAADALKCLVLLHGIYGRGRNWSSIARSLIRARPDYRCLLVDLPHHGESGKGVHGATIAGLAADIGDWLAGEGLAPDAILGHSLSGKVALSMASGLPDRALQLWVVDSTPDPRPPSGSAWDMLQSVRQLPDTFASRETLIEALTAGGWATGVAEWMATNLIGGDDGFVWQLDFDVMEQLIVSFAETNLWSVVDRIETPHVFHVVKATRSDVLSAGAVDRLESIGPPRVRVHHLDGGHWIHAERPDDVVRLLVEHLA